MLKSDREVGTLCMQMIGIEEYQKTFRVAIVAEFRSGLNSECNILSSTR